MNNIKLPPLPDIPADICYWDHSEGVIIKLLQAYATAAIEADHKTTEKQLNAYRGLVNSMETRLSHLQTQYDELKKSTDPGLLASERAANAMLTEELEVVWQASGNKVCQECGGNGAGGAHEDDCTHYALTETQIRDVFLSNGFTIKPGEVDLKPYVYQAARALLEADRQARNCGQCVPLSTDGTAVFIDGVGEVPLDFSGKVRSEPVAYRWRKPIVDDKGETIGYTDWIYGEQKGFLPWWPRESLHTTPQQARGEIVGYFYSWELERSLKAYPNGFPGAIPVYSAPQPQQIPDELSPIELRKIRIQEKT